MSFRLIVSDHKPVISDHIQDILEDFLLDIGYLSGRKTGEEVQESVPFRLWTECLLKNPEQYRTIDEFATILDTSKPTIYRHLNKLKNLDLIEEKELTIEDNGEVIKKGYRLIQGDLTKAWHVTELNVESNMKRYRETVERINKLSKGESIVRSYKCPKCGEDIKKVIEEEKGE